FPVHASCDTICICKRPLINCYPQLIQGVYIYEWLTELAVSKRTPVSHGVLIHTAIIIRNRHLKYVTMNCSSFRKKIPTIIRPQVPETYIQYNNVTLKNSCFQCCSRLLQLC